MAFPASQQLLFEGFQRSRILAVQVKTKTQRHHDDSAAGDVNRIDLIHLVRVLSNAIDEWAEISALPGIGQYARDQLDDQTINIGAEFTAMRNEAISLRDWIVANFPTHNPSGAWLVASYDGTGLEVPLVFTTTDLNGFRTRALSLIATIG